MVFQWDSMMVIHLATKSDTLCTNNCHIINNTCSRVTQTEDGFDVDGDLVGTANGDLEGDCHV